MSINYGPTPAVVPSEWLLVVQFSPCIGDRCNENVGVGPRPRRRRPHHSSFRKKRELEKQNSTSARVDLFKPHPSRETKVYDQNMVATRRRTTRGKADQYEVGDKVEVRKCPWLDVSELVLALYLLRPNFVVGRMSLVTSVGKKVCFAKLYCFRLLPSDDVCSHRKSSTVHRSSALVALTLASFCPKTKKRMREQVKSHTGLCRLMGRRKKK